MTLEQPRALYSQANISSKQTLTESQPHGVWQIRLQTIRKTYGKRAPTLDGHFQEIDERLGNCFEQRHLTYMFFVGPQNFRSSLQGSVSTALHSGFKDDSNDGSRTSQGTANANTSAKEDSSTDIVTRAPTE